MKWSLWGWYSYDNTIFTSFEVPSELFDKDVFLQTLFEVGGDMIPYNQEPTWLQASINNFFKRKANNYARMLEALHTDYKPLENYSMTEDINRKGSNESETNSETTFENLNKVSGYNASSLVNNTQDSNDTVGNATSVGEWEDSEKRTRSGNIGVTTSQQMLQSELELRKFDFYSFAVGEFLETICIQVW